MWFLWILGYLMVGSLFSIIVAVALSDDAVSRREACRSALIAWPIFGIVVAIFGLALLAEEIGLAMARGGEDQS